MTNKKGNKGKGSKKSHRKTAHRNRQPSKYREVPEEGDVERIMRRFEQFVIDDDDCHSPGYITGDAIVNIIHEYFPPELRTFMIDDYSITNDDELRGDEIMLDGGLEVIRKFMDKYPGNFKAYGSVEDVFHQLREYRNFPSSHRYFNVKIDHPYINTKTTQYYMGKGFEMIDKQDLYSIVYHFILSKYPDMPVFCRRFFAIYLKTLETRVNKIHEFGRMTFFPYDRLEDEIKLTKRMLRNNAEYVFNQNQLTPPDADLDEICKQWRSRFYRLVPVWKRVAESDINAMHVIMDDRWIDWNEDEFRPIRSLLESFCTKFPPEQNPIQYVEFIYICGSISDLLFGHCSDEYFVPYDMTKTFREGRLSFIRKFVIYNGVKIVMKSELSHHIPLDFPKDETEESSGFLQTINHMEVVNGGKERYFIEFDIEYQDYSMKPIPILTPFGGFCLYGASGFKSALRRVTSSFRLFQRLYKGDHANRILKQLFDRFERFFDLKQTSPYFIKMEQMRELEDSLSLLYDQIILNPNQNTVIPIEPREIAANGMYTLEELKQQMDDMMLGISFPTIKHKAEKAMKQVRQGQWTTKELIDILDRCQASCFIDKFPLLGKFLHRHFVPHEPCPLCDEEDQVDMADYLMEW